MTTLHARMVLKAAINTKVIFSHRLRRARQLRDIKLGRFEAMNLVNFRLALASIMHREQLRRQRSKAYVDRRGDA